MLALSLAILTVGYAAYALVHVAWQGFVVAAVSGIGVGGFWPVPVDAHRRSDADRATTGGVRHAARRDEPRVRPRRAHGRADRDGGVARARSRPLLARRGVLPRLRGGDARARARRPRSAAAHTPGADGSYREVLRHRPFVAVIGLNALFIFAGFSGFELLPVYAKNEAGLTETQIGIVFFVNTVVIVLAQLPIARLARRAAADAGARASSGLLWAAPGCSYPFAGSRDRGRPMVVLVVAMVVFASASACTAPLQAPLVADLAEPRLLGRYMALSALSWQVGFALGPAIGGFVLDVSPNGVWSRRRALRGSAACSRWSSSPRFRRQHAARPLPGAGV